MNVQQLIIILAILLLGGCDKPLNENAGGEQTDVQAFIPSANQSEFQNARNNAKMYFDHMELGEKLIDERKYDEALAILDQAFQYTTFKGSMGLVHIKIADAHQKRGDYSAAIEHLEKAGYLVQNDIAKSKVDEMINAVRKAQVNPDQVETLKLL